MQLKPTFCIGLFVTFFSLRHFKATVCYSAHKSEATRALKLSRHTGCFRPMQFQTLASWSTGKSTIVSSRCKSRRSYEKWRDCRRSFLVAVHGGKRATNTWRTC